mmetsp:Transcript_29892/g.46625  ORF Transcript_29892/g.46625 Transcript_29892/m.46625 type:complete len:121 (-) Transcript_29892:17-379(-)
MRIKESSNPQVPPKSRYGAGHWSPWTGCTAVYRALSEHPKCNQKKKKKQAIQNRPHRPCRSPKRLAVKASLHKRRTMPVESGCQNSVQVRIRRSKDNCLSDELLAHAYPSSVHQLAQKGN